MIAEVNKVCSMQPRELCQYAAVPAPALASGSAVQGPGCWVHAGAAGAGAEAAVQLPMACCSSFSTARPAWRMG